MDSLISTYIICILVFAITLAFGFIGASMAKNRGRDPSVWFVISAASNVVGLCALAQSPVVLASEKDSNGDKPEESVDDFLQLEEMKWMLSKGIKSQKSTEVSGT